MTAGLAQPDAATEQRPAPHARVGCTRRVRRPAFVASALWLAVLVAAALLAPILPIPDPGRPIGQPRQLPSWSVDGLLGTDHLGRSMLSRLLYGARQSLAISVGAVAVAVVLGSVIGILAGYCSGWIDKVVGVVVDSALAFPPLMLLLALTAVMEPSVPTLVTALALLLIPTIARMTRGHALTLSKREHVLAVRLLGGRHARIMFRDVLPLIGPPTAALAVILLSAAIVAEGSLSFLGLGVPPPTPSWGGMIAAARPDLASSPWLVVAPGLMLFVTVVAFTTIGDHVQRRQSRASGLA